MDSASQLLLQILSTYGIEARAAEKLVEFRDMVCAENEVQNLTRITEPGLFAEEHIRDSFELLKTGWLHGKVVDLGTGGGFPGIPCAILDPAQSWLLMDAERNKIDFVKRAIEGLELAHVEAVHGRAEDLLRFGNYEFVVSRAVGPIERIYNWIAKCSTWNNLVLMKGPKWDEEWLAFQKTPHGKKLLLREEARYEVGPEKKKRKLVWLSRV